MNGLPKPSTSLPVCHCQGTVAGLLVHHWGGSVAGILCLARPKGSAVEQVLLVRKDSQEQEQEPARVLLVLREHNHPAVGLKG